MLKFYNHGIHKIFCINVKDISFLGLLHSFSWFSSLGSFKIVYRSKRNNTIKKNNRNPNLHTHTHWIIHIFIHIILYIWGQKEVSINEVVIQIKKKEDLPNLPKWNPKTGFSYDEKYVAALKNIVIAQLYAGIERQKYHFPFHFNLLLFYMIISDFIATYYIFVSSFFMENCI